MKRSVSNNEKKFRRFEEHHQQLEEEARKHVKEKKDKISDDDRQTFKTFEPINPKGKKLELYDHLEVQGAIDAEFLLSSDRTHSRELITFDQLVADVFNNDMLDDLIKYNVAVEASHLPSVFYGDNNGVSNLCLRGLNC